MTARRCPCLVDGAEVGRGHVPATTAYYFSFDETFNVGRDRGTPVTDDYPPVHNAFTGSIHGVRVDLAQQVPLDADGRPQGRDRRRGRRSGSD